MRPSSRDAECHAHALATAPAAWCPQTETVVQTDGEEVAGVSSSSVATAADRVLGGMPAGAAGRPAWRAEDVLLVTTAEGMYCTVHTVGVRGWGRSTDRSVTWDEILRVVWGGRNLAPWRKRPHKRARLRQCQAAQRRAIGAAASGHAPASRLYTVHVGHEREREMHTHMRPTLHVHTAAAQSGGVPSSRDGGGHAEGGGGSSGSDGGDGPVGAAAATAAAVLWGCSTGNGYMLGPSVPTSTRGGCSRGVATTRVVVD